MSGKRTFEMVRTLNALDHEVETKVPGLGGPFAPSEIMLVLLAPLVLVVPTVAALWPFIKGWGILSILVWAKLVPMTLMRLKKNKPKSWMWDYRHRLGLGMSNLRHFRRPFSPRAWGGVRTVVRSAWTQPKKGGLVPIAPQHLTYGLPAIRVFDALEQHWRPSITPIPSLGGYAIRTRVYQPSAQRIPHHLRNAVLGQDEQGRAAIQDFAVVLIPWRQKS